VNENFQYLEIIGQLDATDGFLLQTFLLLAQHVSDTIMPIIRSSRVLYRWLLPVILGALVFKLSVWCGAVGYVPVCGMLLHPANQTHNHAVFILEKVWLENSLSHLEIPQHSQPQLFLTPIHLWR